ncbi:MAG: alpha/beta hydrolase domain-containing protein [Gaiellaceae bacterium]
MHAVIAALAAAALLVAPSATSADAIAPVVEGPIPGTAPGDPASPVLSETYPFFSTWLDLAASGYVEEEFYVSGAADAYSTAGAKLASDVPYRTRLIVRRPVSQDAFNGTVLVEWQNVTAGYDLDALWNRRHIRDGYAWVGVSAQRVGVNQLRGWSPTRYGSLEVTGGGAFTTDQLSYDIFAQAAQALRSPGAVDPLGGLDIERVLAIGASQSAGRMTTYYNVVLPQEQPVFDGYAFIVGSAPTRVGPEPIVQVLSETDVSTPLTRRPDSDVFRRWEVAGAAHSGWEGQEYRRSLSIRDLGAAPVYDCTNPPFSRVLLSQVIEAAYGHLARWVDGGAPPPHAPYLEFAGPTTKARNELGLALGGIQLSQVAVPTALNTGSNSGPSFCLLFGTHVLFSEEQLDALYRNHGRYVSAVARTDAANVEAGFLLPADAEENQREAARTSAGK